MSTAKTSLPPVASLSHPKYRPDIDGLRALAVLSVVAFHAFPAALRGGFIGVDVFFVISGYLISTIVFENLDRGTFSFSTFYARRIQRIFPALLLVLSASYAFGWFALLANEYKQLGQHIAAGAGFISNFMLWGETGYFDNSAESKPLLHLWSLGIEEQFYIVWPALLWFAHKRKFNLLTLTIVVAAISFYLNVKGLKKDAVATFYSPQTRVWELLCGTVLAWMTLHPQKWLDTLRLKIERGFLRVIYSNKHTASIPVLPNILSSIGLLLLVYGFMRIHKTIGFPGRWALVPVLGAVLIIAAGPQAWINRTVLSHRLAVGFGLISFPLYLWHWPILSFANIIENGHASTAIRAGAIVLCVLLAWLTYRLLERPVRLSPNNRRKTVILTMLMVGMGFIGMMTHQKQGLPSRHAIEVTQQVLKDTEPPETTRNSDGSCEKLLNLKPIAGSVCLTHSTEPDVLVVGDSHAMALNSAAYLGKIKAHTLLIGTHGCAPLSGYSVLDGDKPRVGCSGLDAQIFEAITRVRSIKKVVIATRGPLYFSGEGSGFEGKSPFSIAPFSATPGANQTSQAEMFHQGYSAFVAKIITLGKEAVFVIDAPELQQSAAQCIRRPLSLTEKAQPSCDQSKVKVLARQAVYRDMVAKIQSDNPALKIYDSLNQLCDQTTCYAMRNDLLMYWDDDHISVSASAMLLRDLLK
jgi:peptidoglycan/LPS O-acetylase OafA/YrhL